MSSHNTTCLIERRPTAQAIEFASLSWPPRDINDADWPVAPGAVRHDALGRPVLLHFAPGRWLAPDPGPETRALIERTADAGAGVLVDVSGKWEALIVSGPGAQRLLACAISIQAVLDGRECAAVTLFDCPAIVARVNRDFALWVQASYATDFIMTAERFRTALEIDA